MQTIHVSELTVLDILRNKFKLPEIEAREITKAISSYNETVSEQIETEVNKHIASLASKKDIEISIEKLRVEIHQSKTDTIKWMVSLFIGFFLAITGTLITLITLLK